LFKEEDIGLQVDSDLVNSTVLGYDSIKTASSESKEISLKNKEDSIKVINEYSNLDVEGSYNNAKKESLLNDTFSHTQNTSLKSKEYDALITEYCPLLFANLRQEEQLDYNELILSLDPIENRDSMLKIKESSGKSGSFFFFSHDQRFIIKTIKDHELNTMLGEFMERYYSNIMTNPDSLLTRIYGLYTITIG
jgi:hypothetical protein